MAVKSLQNVSCRFRHYYDIKYPYLNYPFVDVDGQAYIMFSVPVIGLIDMYRQYKNCRPDTFFDCGCATGELIQQADEMGIFATGIDIKKYPITDPKRLRYFEDGRIKIQSVLDMNSLDADLAYCNGTLTYMNTQSLPLVLEKFKNVGMLIAIHNTTEDVRAAAADGWQLLYDEPRLIRSRQWWMNTFRKNGFAVEYNQKYNCFCAMPKQNVR